jgi:8-oxo-dGTP pyrophosphatase MutT (NUDIX family)
LYLQQLSGNGFFVGHGVKIKNYLQAMGYLWPMNTEPTSRIVRAAGGLVENERGEVLFIFRRNKWDLPKGKVDPGEGTEECALREVTEETGLQDIELKEPLIITHHAYEENGLDILKETHWFRIKASGDEPLVPQTEEDITELRWFKQHELAEVKRNTYPNILEVLKAGHI